VLVDRHALLGLSRKELVRALPALRGLTPESGLRSGSLSAV
jgi:hypothetical protein